MRATRGKAAVVFDPHPLWLDAMCRLVEGVGMRVVGSTSDCEEAVELVAERSPDVFIAGADGTDCGPSCVRRALERREPLKAIVVGERRDPEAVDEAFAAGASVYCVRSAETQDLVSALGQAFEQSIFIATDGSHGAAPFENTTAAHGLTRKELEVLKFLAEGQSNAELARTLSVTEKTVKFHLSNIYRKLDVANRTEASRWAHLHGLLPT